MATAQPESREELLANFQGITAIDDVAVAIFHLDESNWDLLTAINRVMPQDIALNHNMGSHSSDGEIEVIDEDISVIKPKSYVMSHSNRNRNSAAGPSTSSGSNQSKILNIHVQHLSNKYEFKISDSMRYSELQQKIADLSGVSPCRQNLNIKDKKHCAKPPSTASLASLALPDPCDIELIPNEIDYDNGLAQRLAQTYTLNINCDGNCRKLHFYGNQTILKVKEDIYSLTSIPVRDQVWDGWPNVPNLDNKMLATIDISPTEHKLTVRKSLNKPSHNKRIPNNTHSDDEDNSDEEFEDAEEEDYDEDICMEESKPNIREPLIPDNVSDEIIGSIRFGERFTERYGAIHPTFFPGSLEEAVKEACMKPAKDRRLLGIYLHHENSISAHLYCEQLLGCESAVEILDANFIVYGWDLTFESNRNLLLSSVSNTLGTVASTTIKSIPEDKLPVLIIIMKIRSNTEIFSVINGNVTLEEFSGQLVEGVDRWTSRRDEEMQEEEERAARQQVKWEQDEAYRQSLEADRAKEEQKKQEELYIKNEKMRVEFERQEAEKRREEIRQAAFNRLPEEPKPDEPDITKIRIKLPDGKSLDRRFKTQTTLQTLMDYLTVQGYPAEEYKIISSWPRRDLTSVSVEQTFFALKLFPQESVMLEKRSSE